MSAIRWTEICTRKHTSTVDTFYSSQESARKGKNTTSVSQKISRHCVEVNSRIVELECKIRCPVIANGRYFKSTNISRYILGHLWTYQVSDAIFLFLKSNEHTGKDVQQNTTDSAQRTYCTVCILMRNQTDAIQLKALHLWRCSPCDILATLREASCSKAIMIRISTEVQLQCM